MTYDWMTTVNATNNKKVNSLFLGKLLFVCCFHSILGLVYQGDEREKKVD